MVKTKFCADCPCEATRLLTCTGKTIGVPMCTTVSAAALCAPRYTADCT